MPDCKNNTDRRSWRWRGLGLLLLMVTPGSQGAGLEVPAGGVRQMGASPAGSAAVPGDATAAVHNPAGLTRLEGWNITVGAHLIETRFDYAGEVRRELIGSVGGTVPGDTHGSSGGNWQAPHGYLAYRINDRAAVGFAFHVPFGTRLSYPPAWAGRYHATRSELSVTALSAVAAWQLTPTLSVGLGPTVQHLHATFENQVDIGYLVADEVIRMVDAHPLASPMPQETVERMAHNFDVHNRMRLSDTAFGALAGVLWQPGNRVRIGIGYRSRVRHVATGHARRPETEDPAYAQRLADAIDGIPVRVAGLLPVPLGTIQPGAGTDGAAQALGPLGAAGGAISLVTHTPEVVTLSAQVRLSPRLHLMGGATYTRWSVIEELRFTYTDRSARGGDDITGSGDDVRRRDLVKPMDWRDTWRYGIGFELMPARRWVLRTGVTFDGSPVPGAERRGPSSPDADRLVLSTGASWLITSNWIIDLGYAHTRLRHADLNQAENPAGTLHRFVGSSQGRLQNLGLQLSWSF